MSDSSLVAVLKQLNLPTETPVGPLSLAGFTLQEAKVEVDQTSFDISANVQGKPGGTLTGFVRSGSGFTAGFAWKGGQLDIEGLTKLLGVLWNDLHLPHFDLFGDGKTDSGPTITSLEVFVLAPDKSGLSDGDLVLRADISGLSVQNPIISPTLGTTQLCAERLGGSWSFSIATTIRLNVNGKTLGPVALAARYNSTDSGSSYWSWEASFDTKVDVGALLKPLIGTTPFPKMNVAFSIAKRAPGFIDFVVSDTIGDDAEFTLNAHIGSDYKSVRATLTPTGPASQLTLPSRFSNRKGMKQLLRALDDLHLKRASFSYRHATGDPTAWRIALSGSVDLGSLPEVDVAIESADDMFAITIAGVRLERDASKSPGQVSSVYRVSDPQPIDLVPLLSKFGVNDPSALPLLTVQSAFFATSKDLNSDKAKRLFGLDLGLGGASKSSGAFDIAFGSDTVSLEAVSLLYASDTWSADDVATANLQAPDPTGAVYKGVTASAMVKLGDQEHTFALSSRSGPSPAATAPTPPSSAASLMSGVGGGNAMAPGQATSSGVSAPTPPASPPLGWTFDVGRQIGPVLVQRVGLGLRSAKDGASVAIGVDGAIAMGPLTVDLIDLAITVPTKLPFDPTKLGVGLGGLNVKFDKPGLTIAGGLVHDSAASSYTGSLVVNAGALALSAIGEYADVSGKTSLFVFASLNDPPLGGPPFCFITGLAGGFGYNSRLNLPTTTAGLATFPLLGTPPGGDLGAVRSAIKPSVGDDWLAAGVLFRSFDFVQSEAMLAVTFGNRLQFALLGQSTLSLPLGAEAPLVHAVVDLIASYVPADGLLEVLGVLAPDSYVLSSDCHLTGGFAFCLWDSGDFVVTFGGYNRHFDYAAKGYPAVPRIGIDWKVDAHTSISGYEYFAITPGLMMAGGGLKAVWDCGIFSAWFDADFDLLLHWRPFYYEGDFQMSLGVAFDLRILFIHVHFSFHISASISIAGPPFHGTASIDLDVVSFTVTFGPQPSGLPPPIAWPDFRKMLPGDASADSTDCPLLSARVVAGAVPGAPKATPSTCDLGAVDGTRLRLVVDCAVPVLTVQYQGAAVPAPTGAATSLGVQPMQVDLAASALTVTLSGPTASPQVVASTATRLVPAATWAPQPAKGKSGPSLDKGSLTATTALHLDAGPPTGLPGHADQDDPPRLPRSDLLGTPLPVPCKLTRPASSVAAAPATLTGGDILSALAA